MQRVRRDSASSTDSWSIIEQMCSPEVSEEVLDSEECDSDSEIEIGEEAFDSHDSDIEVDEEHEEEKDKSEIDEEGEEEKEMSEDEEEEEEQSEEENEEEEQEPETEDAPEWGLLSQKEAMSGEGKHFVNPEKIKSRFDTVIERRDNSQKVALFLKVSLACFVIQNLILFYSLILSRPIYHSAEIKNIRMQSFSPFVYNNSASLQCWSPRAAAIEVQNAKMSSSPMKKKEGFYYTNMTWEEFKFSSLNFRPTFTKAVKPSKYGWTTISRQRSPLQVCLRRDIPPTTLCSIYPCHQKAPMPTPPARKEPESPFSALRNIIKNYTPLKPKSSPKPRARSFNYKLEVNQKIHPAPKVKESPKTQSTVPQQCPTKKRNLQQEFLGQKEGKIVGVIKSMKSLKPQRKTEKVYYRSQQKATPISQAKKSFEKSKTKAVSLIHKPKNEMTMISQQKSFKKLQETFVPKKMNIKQKKRFSSKASQLMRNSSYVSHHHQCKREEFKQFKKIQLEDKSRRRRQRLLEYKVEKPCRAVYEEKRRHEKIVKKIDKLQAKIQKKMKKIENRLHKKKPLSA